MGTGTEQTVPEGDPEVKENLERDSDVWITTVLPAVVIAVILVLAACIACILYKVSVDLVVLVAVSFAILFFPFSMLFLSSFLSGFSFSLFLSVRPSYPTFYFCVSVRMSLLPLSLRKIRQKRTILALEMHRITRPGLFFRGREL